MAFWDRPFDLFRSALAVDGTNGLPPEAQARQLSSLTNSHVLLCGDGHVTLWIREWPDTVKDVAKVTTSRLPQLLEEYRDELERAKIAESKIRLRQYALYETDTQGNKGSWFIEPDIKRAKDVFSQIGYAVQRNCKHFGINHASWLYRILVLRIGLDREWRIAQGLSHSAVSDFATRGEQYPTLWTMQLSSSERERIAETVLETLRDFNFSHIDPLLLLQALRIPIVKKVEKSIDLFPTPKSAAWDMIDSIPIHDEMMIYDPTVGTGTFLIAAAQSFWNRCGSREGMIATLRKLLCGSDISPFAVDLSQMSLDLAFGWDDGGWAITHAPAERIASRISSESEWVVVGNPPWNAKSRSDNEASKILAAYIDALATVPRCWMGTITPRSVWTKRDQYGAKIRDGVAGRFQVESMCELPWGTIEGGRAQAIAALLSRGRPRSATVWKRNDSRNVIHTIGYNRADSRDPLLSPDGSFLMRRLSGTKPIHEYYNVRIGLQPRSIKEFPSAPVGDIPYVLKVGMSPGSSINVQRKLIEDRNWVTKNFIRPADAYRKELFRLPQIAISGNIYEGLSRLRVQVIETPKLFSNRFFVCTPRKPICAQFAHGVKTILTSTFGKLWMHIFAFAGRHIAKTDLETFPLPASERVIRIGSECLQGDEWETHLRICKTYELSEEESAIIMTLGHILGLSPKVPRQVVQKFQPNQHLINRIRRELSSLDSNIDTTRLHELELKMLDEQDKSRYMLLSGEDFQIAIDKEAL